MRPLCRPSPCWGGENGKKKAKLVGRDKGSFTEQQRKQTVTTTILIYKINTEMHRATLTAWCPVRSQAADNCKCNKCNMWGMLSLQVVRNKSWFFVNIRTVARQGTPE